MESIFCSQRQLISQSFLTELSLQVYTAASECIDRIVKLACSQINITFKPISQSENKKSIVLMNFQVDEKKESEPFVSQDILFHIFSYLSVNVIISICPLVNRASTLKNMLYYLPRYKLLALKIYDKLILEERELKKKSRTATWLSKHIMVVPALLVSISIEENVTPEPDKRHKVKTVIQRKFFFTQRQAEKELSNSCWDFYPDTHYIHSGFDLYRNQKLSQLESGAIQEALLKINQKKLPPGYKPEENPFKAYICSNRSTPLI